MSSKPKPKPAAPTTTTPAPAPVVRGPAKVHTLTAWALVHRRGGVAPLRVELDVSEDLTRAEVVRVELGQEDYRAITERKVLHLLSSHTPTWEA